MLGARRRAPPTRSRSPVAIEAHRCLKRTEQFHLTNEAPAARSERNHSTLQTRPPQPEANGTIPPSKRPSNLRRTKSFHKTQKSPRPPGPLNAVTAPPAEETSLSLSPHGALPPSRSPPDPPHAPHRHRRKFWDWWSGNDTDSPLPPECVPSRRA